MDRTKDYMYLNPPPKHTAIFPCFPCSIHNNKERGSTFRKMLV